MSGAMEEAIRSSTGRIMGEVEAGRAKAHAKHGENSIEALSASSPGWGDILGEEGGEVAEVIVDNFRQAILSKAIGRTAHANTYDGNRELLRAELLDVASVAVAWIAAIDRELDR